MPMQKKGKKQKGGRKERLAVVTPYEDVHPDLEEEDVINDEIHQFVKSKDSASLAIAKKKIGSGKKKGTKELYPVGSASEENSDDESDDNFDSDLDVKQNEEDYLPSADAWGKQRSAFYDTDYKDKDYGVFSDESDEEAAALEEMEADTLHRKLLATTNATDYQLPQPNNIGVTDYKDDDLEIVVTKRIASIQNEEEDPLMSEQLQELFHDFKDKRDYLQNTLVPLQNLIKNGRLPDLPVFNIIKSQAAAYASYCLNLQFYFYLLRKNEGEKLSEVNNHPVLDKIIHWRTFVIKTDEIVTPLMPQIKYLMDNLDSVEMKDVKGEQNNGEEIMEEGNMEEYFEDEDGQRRPVDKMISKNEGLRAHSKKSTAEKRNPRTKHKRGFKKATIKRKSTIPPLRSQLEKYGGEARGIKANIVRSLKLT